MTYEGNAWASDSSVDLGSDTVAVVRMADVLAAVKEARDEQKMLLQQARDDLQQARDDLQQARDEQKMHTTKVLRAISDMMMLGVATLIVVIVLCTFVLYTKPPVSHTTCEPMVNHTKWEPVNHTTCEPPVNNNTVNIIVHVHVNATSTIDTPENKCFIDDTHNISHADQKFIIGAVVVGPSLAATITAAVATALGY